MGYFDDCHLHTGAEMPACQCYLDRSFPGTWSLEYLHAGRMEMSIDGGPMAILDRPAAFWHLPDRRYRYGAIDARGWDHHWIMLSGPRAPHLIGELQRVHPAGWSSVTDPTAFRARMRVLIGLARRGDPTRQSEAVAAIEDLVASLVAQPIGTGRLAAVRALAERMRAAPTRPWPLVPEARALALSEVQLRRLFRRVTDLSPVAWCISCRMQSAARALTDGASVAAAGRQAGYEDPHQFARMFRRTFGRGPRAWQAVLPTTA